MLEALYTTEEMRAASKAIEVEFGYRVTWPAAKKITYGQGS